MNNPEQKKVTTPQAKAQEKLTDEQLERLNAGIIGATINGGVKAAKPQRKAVWSADEAWVQAGGTDIARATTE